MGVKLGVRARNVLRNLGVTTPAGLTALADADGGSLAVFLLRVPNCGRKTYREILDWHQEGRAPDMPEYVWVRVDKDYNGSLRVFSVSNEPRNEPTWYRAKIEAEQNKPETRISERPSEQDAQAWRGSAFSENKCMINKP
jgi:hypothetical protein